jgi:alpha-beta hydrolase superfamily lysophospholipase
LIVTLHGGPAVNTTLNYHVTTRRYLALGFDVLDIDYRGSPGYGEAHFRALHDNPGGILVEDLRAAVAWARTQRRYRGHPIGASGNSFGGLAIVTATQQPIEGLDFGVSDSGLTEMTPQYRQRMCRDVRYDWMYVFGTVGQGADCELKPTGASDWRRFSPLPVFLLLGGKDQLVSDAIGVDWAAAANAGGGCASLFRNAEGGHGIDGWRGEGRAAAEAALADWIDRVVERKGDRCGRSSAWPATLQ